MDTFVSCLTLLVDVLLVPLCEKSQCHTGVTMRHLPPSSLSFLCLFVCLFVQILTTALENVMWILLGYMRVPLVATRRQCFSVMFSLSGPGVDASAVAKGQLVWGRLKTAPILSLL